MPSKHKQALHPQTQAAHAGGAHAPLTGGVVPALQPSSTYARDGGYALVNANTQYSRDDNPTYAHAEELPANLDQALGRP